MKKFKELIKSWLIAFFIIGFILIINKVRQGDKRHGDHFKTKRKRRMVLR